MLIQKQYNKLILQDDANKTFFLIEEAKETELHFSDGTVKVL